ncbi:MAG: FAD-dependent oxidoreductase [Actinomycetota bacterium]
MTAGRSPEVPDHSPVVVVGGGIVGASIAYHLARAGRGVLLLERHQLTGGTTWHAAGLVAQLRSTENTTRLARYSLELYATLRDETEQDTGFRQPGAISMASTANRWEELRRTAAMARYLGIEATEITAAEIAERFPLATTDDLHGGIWLPQDGVVGPSDCTMALARGARLHGARLVEGVGVSELLVDDAGRSAGWGRPVTGVRLDDGREVTADAVVLACGLWTRHLAATAGVEVPLMAAEHHYVVTEPIEGLSAEWPVLRDPDRWAYLKPEAGGSMLVGLFEPVGRPWPAAGPPPIDRPFITMEPDADHLSRWLVPAFDRIPALHETGLRLLFDGPEAFTPDDAYILGETPGRPGLFVAAGFNSIGVQSAGGAGMAIAHWVEHGEPPFDLHDVDIRRFERFQNNESYLRQRTTEVLGLLYASHHPHRDFETARGVRRSPLHHRLAERGACFAELNGWERPAFFARPELGVEPVHHDGWGPAPWLPANRVEHLAVREAVGVFDLSSFSTFDVAGGDAAGVLDHLSAGDVAGDVGRSVYTQWCNDRGGIEADLTVSRVGPDRFRVIGGAGTRRRDLDTLQQACAGRNASVTDLTSAFAVLAVMGPNSRELLGGLTAAELSDEAFPFATNAEIEVGDALVWANRMSYVGELGWELFVPSEFALHVLDALLAAGDAQPELGLELCGYHALNSLRFERGYRHWGHDITPDDTPIEAGLSFAVAWDKDGDFRGREALEKQRARGATKRLVQVKLRQGGWPTDADTRLLHHNEPLWRSGERVGYVTGGMWGHSVDAAVGMALAVRGPADDPTVEPVDRSWVAEGAWAVELPGGPVPADVQLLPWLR